MRTSAAPRTDELGLRPSTEPDLTPPEVNGQPLSPQKVQAENPVDRRRRREYVSHDRERYPSLPESFELVDGEARNVLDPAAGGHLQPVWRRGRVVTDRGENGRAYQC